MKKFAWIGFWATMLLVSCGTKTDPATPSTLAPADSQPAPLLGDDVQSSEGEEMSAKEMAELENRVESAWGGNYAGKLDDKIEVSLELHGLGDAVRGTITYKKSGKPIMVLGTMNTDGTFFLHEFQPDGNVTGVMSGSEKSHKLSGTWYAPNSDREMKLELDAITVQEEGSVGWPYPAKKVSGEYGYHYSKDGPAGALVVKQAGDKVRFSFDCVTSAPGRNMAMLDEIEAPLVDGVAHYKMPDMECEFTIRFFDGFAMVGYANEKYDCGFGHNATIEGEFVKLK